MTKYKVLQVHNYYKVPGGEDTVVANEKHMLESRGHKVVTYYRNNDELDSMGMWGKFFFPLSMIFNFKTYKEVKQIIAAENIDIVHVHNTLARVSHSVYYAARKMHVPVVQTVHNYRFICANALLYREGHTCEDCIKNGLGCAVKHSCYRNSKLQTIATVCNMRIHRVTGILKSINYIFLTEFNKNKICGTGVIPKDKSHVKANFATYDKGINVSVATMRQDYMVYIGRLDEIKGADIALMAWKLARDRGIKLPKLYICGTGVLEEDYKKFVDDNGISDVEFKGFVEHSELIELLARSKGLVFSTKVYEGFPMSIVEAYSTGTPVIAPNFGNAGDLVQDGITGKKYVQGNESDLVDAIVSIQKLEEEKPNIFDDIRSYFENHYTEEENYKSLINIYDRVIKNHE